MENKRKLSKALLDEIAGIKIRLEELYTEASLLSLDKDGGAFLMDGVFQATFDEYEVEAREGMAYPEELSAYHNGVKFFCIR